MVRRYNILSLFTLITAAAILLSASAGTKCPHEANIQLDKQAVFYAGVDNPITISVSGIPSSDIQVEITGNAKIAATKKPGGYIVTTDSLSGKVQITVSYVLMGRTITAGLYEYRIKRIPDPVTYVGSIRGEGFMIKSLLPNISGVFTRMENFDFVGRFHPQSFSMSVFHDSVFTQYNATGPALNAEMKAALQNVRQEDKIIFHNVVTKGPDSTLRRTNPVIITVK
jgi:hypothetical protein